MMHMENFDEVFSGVDLSARRWPSERLMRIILARKAVGRPVIRYYLDWEQQEAREAFAAQGMRPCGANGAWFTQDVEGVRARTISVFDSAGNTRNFNYIIPPLIDDISVVPFTSE